MLVTFTLDFDAAVAACATVAAIDSDDVETLADFVFSALDALDAFFEGVDPSGLGIIAAAADDDAARLSEED